MSHRIGNIVNVEFCCRTARGDSLRIWGSGVRISSGAPASFDFDSEFLRDFSPLTIKLAGAATAVGLNFKTGDTVAAKSKI